MTWQHVSSLIGKVSIQQKEIQGTCFLETYQESFNEHV